MSTRNAASEERLDEVFGALADRTRRALVRRLTKSPAAVSELAAPFDMSLPAVSKHLAVLERAALVRRRREGRSFVCEVDLSTLDEAMDWLGAQRAFWDDTLAALAHRAEAAPRRAARRAR